MEDEQKQLPNFVTWTIKHYQQRLNWDCGLSCVLMCLKDEKREDILKDVSALCREEGFGQSTWTIDLCYIIKNKAAELNFLYTTVTLGVDPGYANQAFYDTILKKDNERVTQRFKEAGEKGIMVDKRSVDTLDLINHLAYKGVCIVLTNANLLGCETCENKSCFGGRNEVSKCLSWCGVKTAYQGHYVVMCGYNLPQRKIIYRNPGAHDCECVMSFERFDDARTSYGTDEDVVFLDLDLEQQVVDA